MIDFSKFTKAELLDKKAHVDAAAATARSEVSEAKRRAVADGVFLRPEAMRELEDRAHGAGRLSQRIQTELGERNRREKAANIAAEATVERWFVNICRTRLHPELFNDLMAEAKVASAKT